MKFFIQLFVGLLFVLPQSIQAQPQFYDEIQAFKKSDSTAFPPQHAILFVGSSSFRLWPDIQSYFPGYTIINRGFGGSSFTDVIYYADDIIFPYHPKQIVIYCGDNDLAASDTVSAQTVFNRFKKLFELIRHRMANVPVIYVAIKPSPSRERLMPKMEQANALISKYLSSQQQAAFVDVYHLMLKNGKPLAGIFKEDNLHMNAKGYAIWQKAIEPYLLK